MSQPFRLLVDECASAAQLLRMLRAAGYDVASVLDTLGIGTSDDAVFAYGKREKRSILTRDCADFVALHEADTSHFGLLLIYEDGDRRDMSFSQVVRAIERARKVHHDGFAGKVIVLNHFS